MALLSVKCAQESGFAHPCFTEDDERLRACHKRGLTDFYVLTGFVDVSKPS